MAINKKDRKYILKNHPGKSIKDLARELSLKPAEVRDFLKSQGREVQQDSPRGAPPKLKSAKISMLGVMVLVAVISVVYLNSMRNDFHYDDIHSLLQNFGVRVEWTKDPGTRSLFWRYFVEPELFSSRPNVGMPRPILMNTFAANYALGTVMCDKFGYWCGERGYDPRGWMLANVLVHLFNVILVYIMISHFSGRPRVALLTALLFAVHPINAETVNYINCRSESLGAFFMLLTIYFFTRSLRDEKKWMLILGFVFFWIGLLTKEIVFITPFILLWIDVVFVYPSTKGGISIGKRALMWYAPLIAMMGLYLIYRHEVFSGDIVKPSGTPVKDYWLTQTQVAMTYIRLLFLPAHQNISYENNIISVSNFVHDWRATLSVLGAVAVLAFMAVVGLVTGLSSRFKNGTISLAVVLFFAPLSMTSLVPMNAIMNEHRPYIPSIGACLLIVAALYWLSERVKEKAGTSGPAWPMNVQALTLVIFLSFVSLTVARNFTWHTDLTIWLDSISKSPTKAQVVSDLGNAYYRGGRDVSKRGGFVKDGKIDKKERLVIAQIFKRDVPEGTINPGGKKVLDELYLKGLMRAEKLYQWGIRVERNYYKAWHNLGTINFTYARIELENKNIEKAKRHMYMAIEYFTGATRIVPNGESFNDMGSTIMQLYKNEEDQAKKSELLKMAEKNYRKGIRFNPDLQKGYINLAMVLENQAGEAKTPEEKNAKFEEALIHIKKAIEVNRVNPHPHYFKGSLFRKMKRYDEAIKAYNDCLYYNPKSKYCKDGKAKVEKMLKSRGAP